MWEEEREEMMWGEGETVKPSSSSSRQKEWYTGHRQLQAQTLIRTIWKVVREGEREEKKEEEPTKVGT